MDSIDLSVLTKEHDFLYQIDAELYLSVIIILISDRNLLVSSTNESETIKQLSYILTYLLNLNHTVFDCSKDETIPDSDLVMITNIEKTTVDFQRSINHHFDSKMIIVIISDHDGYEVDLVDELNQKLLFRSPHFPVETFNIDSKYIIVQDSNSIIAKLRSKLTTVTMVQEIIRYINDILTFLRNHRMVSCGIPGPLKNELKVLIKTVAVINNISYVTPSIVRFSCEKFFPLHLDLVADPRKEPTLLWGSDIRLVEGFVELWDQDLVVADVLKNVQPPL